MGRPKGEAARSKSRPSSSSLAASLISSDHPAAAIVGFGGYLGSSRFDSLLSGDNGAPFVDVDSEMAQHLKRLARKDYTTKLKALASLSSLLKGKPGKDIIPIIPQWENALSVLIDAFCNVHRCISGSPHESDDIATEPTTSTAPGTSRQAPGTSRPPIRYARRNR